MNFLFLLALVSFAHAAPDVVHHPAPKKPVYLNPDWYPTLKGHITPPPAAGTAGQKQDEETLWSLQKSRSADDCKRAQSEVLVSLGNFFGAPLGPLEEKSVAKLTAFFEQIRNDGDFFVQKLKKEFPRKRPFLYVKGLEPCVPKEVTDAYPSGHAVLSRLYALVLSDMFPDKKAAIEARADQISNDRVLAGMHHPSDIASGRAIGEQIYAELKKNPKYQSDLRHHQPKAR